MSLIIDRFNSETPTFWKRFGNKCLIAGILVSAVGGALIAVPEGVMPGWIAPVVIALGAALSGIGKGLAELTTTSNELSGK